MCPRYLCPRYSFRRGRSFTDGIGGEVILPKGYVCVHKTNAEDYWMDDRRTYNLENAVYTVKKL